MEEGRGMREGGGGLYCYRAQWITVSLLFSSLSMMCRGQYMYDMAANTANCVPDPPYNATFCGFNDQPGCLPLNGCGEDSTSNLISSHLIHDDPLTNSLFCPC
jgi:hypothetical protein